MRKSITANHHPVYSLPTGQTAGEKLRELCLEGLRERYQGNAEMLPGGQPSQLVQERLDRELSVINKLGAANYFLIVWDFINHARETGIPASAVGSASGALVCHALYISHVCPLKHGLLFERFLTEAWKYPVDLLINVCKERFQELVLYLREKYGEDCVAQTKGCGFVISDRPLANYLAVTSSPELNQWTSSDVEDAGVLHLGCLGVRDLTVLSKAVNFIEQAADERFDLQELPLDDEETFQLIRRGDTKGVFHLSSEGIRDLLRQIKPEHFYDIVAVLAVYRPGPIEAGIVEMYVDAKRGQKRGYKIDVVNEILSETYGVMVYQEQVMRILNRVGRIGLADAYKAIKEISIRQEKESVAAFYERYMEGAASQGFCEADANDLWKAIMKYTGLGFCKSHAVGQALIAYQTAFLKAHYPDEFKLAYRVT